MPLRHGGKIRSLSIEINGLCLFYRIETVKSLNSWFTAAFRFKSECPIQLLFEFLGADVDHLFDPIFPRFFEPAVFEDSHILLVGMLFSDQSLIRFVDRFHKEGKEFDSFYDLIRKERVFISDYRGKDLDRISFLVGYGVIETHEDGQITVADIAKATILHDLFLNDVINKKHYPKEAEHVFCDWIAKGLLRVGNSLLSEPEVHYFNYLLNDAEYVNGPKIRNKYSHGIMQMNPNEAVHQDNFYTLLRILIILAIKINDDFCLNEQQLKDKAARRQK